MTRRTSIARRLRNTLAQNLRDEGARVVCVVHATASGGGPASSNTRRRPARLRDECVLFAGGADGPSRDPERIFRRGAWTVRLIGWIFDTRTKPTTKPFAKQRTVSTAFLRGPTVFGSFIRPTVTWDGIGHRPASEYWTG